MYTNVETSTEPRSRSSSSPMEAMMLSARSDGNEQTQRAKAYESLQRLLVMRRIPEGQRLRETEWSARLGVNRTALREAMARLHSEGLLAEGQKTGYFVPRLSREHVAEIQEIRLGLETLAIERLIRVRECRRGELKPLHALCDELDWLIRRGYDTDITEADSAFHGKLVELSGSERLTVLHRCLPHVGLTEAIVTRVARWQDVSTEVLRDHRELVEALADADFFRARSRLRSHLGFAPEPL